MKNKKKKISRKTFILKSSKGIAGFACSGIVLSAIQSCGIIEPPESIADLNAVCPCHLASFSFDGSVLRQPNNSITENIAPLKKYDTNLLNNELSINIDGNILTLDISNLNLSKDVGSHYAFEGDEYEELPRTGILLYFEENNVIALDRSCTHEGCQVGPFINNES